MSNKLLNFKSHKCFYTYLNNLLPLFEVRESVAKGRFTFVYDGEIKPYRNLYQFLGELNSLLEAELFLIKPSRITSRTRYKIFVDSEVEGSLLPKSEVEVVPVAPQVVEQEVEVTTVESTEEVVSFEVDWKWIESLEDTPDNKLLLDEYAEKHSKVTLKRNMKLTNMVRAYKKALAEK